MVKKSNGSIPRASTNLGIATKVSEEIPIIDQVLPDVHVSGNCFTQEKYFDSIPSKMNNLWICVICSIIFLKFFT